MGNYNIPNIQGQGEKNHELGKLLILSKTSFIFHMFMWLSLGEYIWDIWEISVLLLIQRLGIFEFNIVQEKKQTTRKIFRAENFLSRDYSPSLFRIM